jgi:hypothetical protein
MAVAIRGKISSTNFKRVFLKNKKNKNKNPANPKERNLIREKKEDLHFCKFNLLKDRHYHLKLLLN